MKKELNAVIKHAWFRYFWISSCGVFFLLQSISVEANNVTLTDMVVRQLTNDSLQLQLEMTGSAPLPKVFSTTNPARIALDFYGVSNGLDKKTRVVNKGLVTNLVTAEVADRLRVVVNLQEITAFDTKVVGNKVLLTLSGAESKVPVAQPALVTASSVIDAKPVTTPISSLLPEQTISHFDFKRGDNGEGKILISLVNPNTVVNAKEERGNVVISFINTHVSPSVSKRLDVTEFATPVKFIDINTVNQETKLTVSMLNNFYDYSLFQSEGLLTIEFREVSSIEKQALEKEKTKYTGERLSLNFQNIDIRSVIAILAEFTGQNVVAGDDVVGSITLKLDDVPWDEALDFVMMTKGLEKYETNNVTLIAPVGKIKEYKEKQKETEIVVEQMDPLITEYIEINYAKAENFRNLLYGKDTGAFGSCGGNSNSESASSSDMSDEVSAPQSSNQDQSPGMLQGLTGNMSGGVASAATKSEPFKLLSSRGSVVVDARTNTLIIRETAKRLEDVKKLIRKLDVTVRQVMIESRIVVASNSFVKELGTRFGVAGAGSSFGGTGGLGTVGVAGTAGSVNGTALLNDALVDLGTSTTPYGALGMTLARGADYVLNLELSALQDEGLGELVSNPRVMTTDRCQASIKQGVQIPYQSSSANQGTKVQFKEAVLQLDVTPQVTPSGSIIMDLFISKDAQGALTNNIPSIDTQNVKTNVRVNDGETVVLGGIYEGTTRNNVNKVPFFADLPGIGFLFQHTLNKDDKKELLIFVTPKVIKDSEDDIN